METGMTELIPVAEEVEVGRSRWRRCSRMLLNLTLLNLNVATGCTNQMETSYLIKIGELVLNPPRAPEELREMVGVSLERTAPESHGELFEGNGMSSEGLQFDHVEFRSNGTSSLVILRIPTHHSPSRDVILSRFPMLKTTSWPTGRSENEETAYSQEESWGRLSFGFPEHSPTKLRTIVFDFNPN